MWGWFYAYDQAGMGDRESAQVLDPDPEQGVVCRCAGVFWSVPPSYPGGGSQLYWCWERSFGRVPGWDAVCDGESIT